MTDPDGERPPIEPDFGIEALMLIERYIEIAEDHYRPHDGVEMSIHEQMKQLIERWKAAKPE